MLTGTRLKEGMTFRDRSFKRGSTNRDPSEGKESEGEQLEEWVKGMREDVPVRQQSASFRVRQVELDLERMKNAYRRTQDHIETDEAWFWSLKHDLPARWKYYRNGLFFTLFFASRGGWGGFSSSRGFFKGGFPSPPAEFAVIQSLYPDSVCFGGSKTPSAAQWGRLAAACCWRLFSSLILFPQIYFSQILEDSRIRSCVRGNKKRTKLTSFKLVGLRDSPFPSSHSPPPAHPPDPSIQFQRYNR